MSIWRAIPTIVSKEVLVTTMGTIVIGIVVITIKLKDKAKG